THPAIIPARMYLPALASLFCSRCGGARHINTGIMPPPGQRLCLHTPRPTVSKAYHSRGLWPEAYSPYKDSDVRVNAPQIFKKTHAGSGDDPPPSLAAAAQPLVARTEFVAPEPLFGFNRFFYRAILCIHSVAGADADCRHARHLVAGESADQRGIGVDHQPADDAVLLWRG